MGDDAVPWWADDDELAVALADVGRNLLVDAPATGRVRRMGQHWLAAAAILLVVGAAVVLAIAPARRTVGGWLRVGNLDVQLDHDSATSAPDSTLVPVVAGAGVRALTVEEASELLGGEFAAVMGSSLGPPDQWWALAEGGVLSGWSQDRTTLWVAPLDDNRMVMVDKIVSSADVVTELPDLGDGVGGVAVSGAHVLQTPYRTVAAATVVAWTDGPTMYRLESTTRSVDELIAVAGTLEGAP